MRRDCRIRDKRIQARGLGQHKFLVDTGTVQNRTLIGGDLLITWSTQSNVQSMIHTPDPMPGCPRDNCPGFLLAVTISIPISIFSPIPIPMTFLVFRLNRMNYMLIHLYTKAAVQCKNFCQITLAGHAINLPLKWSFVNYDVLPLLLLLLFAHHLPAHGPGREWVERCIHSTPGKQDAKVKANVRLCVKDNGPTCLHNVVQRPCILSSVSSCKKKAGKRR